MKGWITAALVVTFLSGGTTGYLLGHRPAPPPEEDPYITTLVEDYGVTKPEDIERAKEILREREESILALKNKVMTLLSDQIREINEEATARIQRIIDSYRPPQGK